MSAILVLTFLGLAFLALAALAENTERGKRFIDAVDRRVDPPTRYPFPDHDAEPGDWRS